MSVCVESASFWWCRVCHCFKRHFSLIKMWLFFTSLHYLLHIQGSESVDSTSPHVAPSQEHTTELIPLDKLLSSPSDDDNNGKL